MIYARQSLVNLVLTAAHDRGLPIISGYLSLVAANYTPPPKAWNTEV